MPRYVNKQGVVVERTAEYVGLWPGEYTLVEDTVPVSLTECCGSDEWAEETKLVKKESK